MAIYYAKIQALIKKMSLDDSISKYIGGLDKEFVQLGNLMANVIAKQM